MKVAMLGTGPFVVPTLRALHASTHDVALVVSRPPRGRKREPSPMQVAAEELGLPAWTPETVNCDESRAELNSRGLDLLVVCDYGEILKRATLETARLGGVNLHGSLLPKYRGAAPVQWAVYHGEAVTGSTVIQMTPGLDAGPILGVDEVAVDPDETAEELEARLSQSGAPLVVRVVDQLEAGTAEGVPQDVSLATKAPRLRKEDGLIDWARTALEIKNQVRALQPWPRAYTLWQRGTGEPMRLILHSADVSEGSASDPGTVSLLNGQLAVATGGGLLLPKTVQPTGKKAMAADEFLRGYQLREGDRIG
ncbi:MAG: methionyl-tRNA formyltransferase [Planctomycetota bacterium]